MDCANVQSTAIAVDCMLMISTSAKCLRVRRERWREEGQISDGRTGIRINWHTRVCKYRVIISTCKCSILRKLWILLPMYRLFSCISFFYSSCRRYELVRASYFIREHLFWVSKKLKKLIFDEYVHSINISKMLRFFNKFICIRRYVYFAVIVAQSHDKDLSVICRL